MSLLRAHWRAPALLAVVALAVTAPDDRAAALGGRGSRGRRLRQLVRGEPVATDVGEHAGGGPRAPA